MPAGIIPGQGNISLQYAQLMIRNGSGELYYNYDIHTYKYFQL